MFPFAMPGSIFFNAGIAVQIEGSAQKIDFLKRHDLTACDIPTCRAHSGDHNAPWYTVRVILFEELHACNVLIFLGLRHSTCLTAAEMAEAAAMAAVMAAAAVLSAAEAMLSMVAMAAAVVEGAAIATAAAAATAVGW
jgi:hypothetical protein